MQPNYGFKDLTPLGKALDEIKLLREELRIAEEALLKIRGVVYPNGIPYSIDANNALIEIERMEKERNG